MIFTSLYKISEMYFLYNIYYNNLFLISYINIDFTKLLTTKWIIRIRIHINPYQISSKIIQYHYRNEFKFTGKKVD